MGHVQDRDIAYGRRADGTNILGLFSGIYYQHDEDYLTPQTNSSWRGIWMLNEVANGGCDELPVVDELPTEQIPREIKKPP